MAAVVKLIQDKTPEELAEEYLHNAPAKFIACRGFGHAWPKPGNRRSRKNFVMTQDSDGYSVLEMKCADCGMIRYVSAEPGRRIELPATRYGYIRPDGYSLPKGAGGAFTRKMAASEAMRRYYEELERPTGGEELPEKVSDPLR